MTLVVFLFLVQFVFGFFCVSCGNVTEAMAEASCFCHFTPRYEMFMDKNGAVCDFGSKRTAAYSCKASQERGCSAG